MKKFGRAMILMASLAFLAGTASIDAQEKKAEAPKKGADAAKKAEAPKKGDEKPAGTVEVYKNDKGKWRYKILNDEGKTIAMPLPQLNWETKAEAIKAIDELKGILNSAKPIEPKDEK
jgi:uncharacterized protein YegP (UPF0339 family)